MSSGIAGFESDPEAIDALRHLLGGPGGPPAVEIRCAIVEAKAHCGQLLGTVQDTHRGPVLTIHFWEPGAKRSGSNRGEVTLFLDQAGDVGIYTCRDHGSWRADIEEIRNCRMDGVMRGIPRMNLRIRPSEGTDRSDSDSG